MANDIHFSWRSPGTMNLKEVREKDMFWCILWVPLSSCYFHTCHSLPMLLSTSNFPSQMLLWLTYSELRHNKYKYNIFHLYLVLEYKWNRLFHWLYPLPVNNPYQFSHSLVSDSLWPHGLQHTRPPCPSPTPRACSHSWPSSQWYHPTISSSVIPFSSCLQSFPVPESFPMSQFFTSGGQSFGVSASISVFPMNIQDWFPLGLTGLISFQSKGLSPGQKFKRRMYQ